MRSVTLLKSKLLDFALRGKLSEVITTSDDAKYLLNIIDKHRKSKTNNHKNITQSFTPNFCIPENWEWVKLCDITEFIVDCPHTTAKNEGIGIPLIRTPNVGEGVLILDDVHRVSEEVYNTRNKRAIPQAGDIIYAREAPAGNAAVILPNQKVCLGQRVVLIRPISSICNPKYIAFALLSPDSRFRLISKASGTTGEHVNLEDIRPFYIPLPSKKEQDLIVSKLEKCFSLLDHIQKLSVKNKLSLIKLNRLIINRAIVGLLGTNETSDEPASNLLRKINRNIKLLSTDYHDSPLPKNWALCKLSDIVSYEQPTPFVVSNTHYSDSYETPVLTPGKSFILGYTNDKEGIYDKLPVIIFDDFTTESRLVNFKFKVKSSAMKILTVAKGIDPEYVAAFMSISRLLGDSHKRRWISEYSKLEIPIPPAAEQKRIVEKLNEVNQLISKINSNV